jgi:hypothetical protein
MSPNTETVLEPNESWLTFDTTLKEAAFKG